MLQITQVADAASGVSACTPQLSRDRQLWLAQLDREPAALLQHLSLRPGHRLGVYFEQLWHFFLQQDPDTELIAHNLAVHEAGRTLGEFDCIYYSRQRRCHVHLELAVKFFLGLPRNGDTTSRATAHEWLGPDRRDCLETKLDQLLQRQIVLGDTAAGKRKLAELGIRKACREIALKGYLFQPRVDAPPPPPGYTGECTMSYWIPCGQLAVHCATLAANAFVILPKAEWLSRALRKQHDQTLSKQQLQEQTSKILADNHYPLLIAVLDSNGTESSRFFVAPEHWPDLGYSNDSRASSPANT